MRRCEAITKAGDRCQDKAMDGYQWCYSHRPDLAETRKRNARRGGMAGGRGRSGLSDLDEAKRLTKGLIARLLRGDVARGDAAVAFQGLNTYVRIIGMELRVKDQEEVLERLERLEELQQQRRAYYWT